MIDLITLAQATTWLKLAANTPDAVFVQSLVDSASQEFLTQTQRNGIAVATYMERRNGTGTNRLVLLNRPVQSIVSLTISNTSIPASPDGVQPGYVNDETGIQLVGGWNGPEYFASFLPFAAPGRFTRGVGNIFISYTAGFPNLLVSNEAHAVPAAAPYSITLNQASQYAGELVVTYQSTGETLDPVIGTPTAGQYVIAPTGVMTCAAADSSQVLLCSYEVAGIPADVQKCVFEMVGWAYKNRDRIGMGSERFSENLSNVYSQMPFSPMSKLTINRYTRKDVPTW